MEDNTEIEVLEEETEVEVVPEEPVETVEPVEDPEHTTEEFTKLLEDYIKEQLNNEKSEEAAVEDEAFTEETTEEVPVVSPDSDLLSSILATQVDTNNEIRAQNVMLEDIQVNNMLASSINDISLTNFLLIVLMITLMFNAVLNFSRRIF